MAATEIGELDRRTFLVPGISIRRGQLIGGRYRVEELLGVGASGIVVAAAHIWLGREVALKVLLPETRAQVDVVAVEIERARVAVRLRGPHVARIWEIGTTSEGLPYVASERFEGRTLEAELAARGRVPPLEAVRWIQQACAGLAEAHAIGLVHGDLKPKNMFLAEGEERILKLLDFGMRSPIQDPSASMWLASPAYLAPEQIMDPEHVDERTDVWALGVILYRLIAGRLPFTASTVSGMLVAVVRDEPSYLHEAPDDLALTVLRCLAKSPAERPQSVEELGSALANFAGDETKQALPLAPSEEEVAWPSVDEEETSPWISAPARYWPNRRQARRRQQRGRRLVRRAIAAACALAIGCTASLLWTPDRPARARLTLDDGSAPLVVDRPSLDSAMLVRPILMNAPAEREPAGAVEEPSPPPPNLNAADSTTARRHLDVHRRLAATHQATWPRMPVARPFTLAPSNEPRPNRPVRSPGPALPSHPRNESYYRTVFTPRRYAPRK